MASTLPPLPTKVSKTHSIRREQLLGIKDENQKRKDSRLGKWEITAPSNSKGKAKVLPQTSMASMKQSSQAFPRSISEVKKKQMKTTSDLDPPERRATRKVTFSEHVQEMPLSMDPLSVKARYTSTDVRRRLGLPKLPKPGNPSRLQLLKLSSLNTDLDVEVSLNGLAWPNTPTAAWYGLVHPRTYPDMCA